MSFARIAERLLQLIPVLFGVSVIVFLMISLTPGDPVEIIRNTMTLTPNSTGISCNRRSAMRAKDIRRSR